MLSVCAPRVVVREELRQVALSASIEATDHYRKGHLYLFSLMHMSLLARVRAKSPRMSTS
jgi:hypothetical protein